MYDSFFFFFQAEDGIRDLTVTGVQTCALPIYETEVANIHWLEYLFYIQKDSSKEIYETALPEDRKSTRLNSSHSQISYAVFCLKKKKNIQTSMCNKISLNKTQRNTYTSSTDHN